MLFSPTYTINMSLAEQVKVFVGNKESGFVDGVGDKAKFNSPRGMIFEKNGNLLIVDSGNHAIRRISPTGALYPWKISY